MMISSRERVLLSGCVLRLANLPASFCPASLTIGYLYLILTFTLLYVTLSVGRKSSSEFPHITAACSIVHCLAKEIQRKCKSNSSLIHPSLIAHSSLVHRSFIAHSSLIHRSFVAHSSHIHLHSSLVLRSFIAFSIFLFSNGFLIK